MSLAEFVPIGLLLLALIVSSALFSAIETALFSLQPQHLERLKRGRGGVAPALARLMENPRRLLSALLFADALVNLPLIVVCLWLLREQVASHVPFWMAALLIFALIVFACDLLPKLFALAKPYRLTNVGVRVLQALMPALDPVARGLQRLTEKCADALTPAALQRIPMLSEEELETLVELSAEEGALHETEREMIQEIIKLGDKTAKNCMTPRVDYFAVPDDLSHEELIPILRAKRYRRVPVYGETPDDILGVLEVQSFLLDPAVPYTEQLTPPSFVTETMKALDLLRSFLSHPQGLAFVVDEHGGIEGLVTLADLIEEIISDAVPLAEKALYIETLGAGRLLASGAARLDDLNELLAASLEEEGIETIGGLLVNRHGGIPRPGTQEQVDGVRMTIRRTSRKRVEEVLLEETDHAPAEEAR